MKLQIESVEGFHSYIKSIKAISPGAIFTISEHGCTVKSRNESASIRAFFRTNVIKAIKKDDEPDAVLPLLDISKLLQAIKLIIETNAGSDTAELNVTKNFLTYNGKAKFKLKTYSEAHLQFHTTKTIDAKTKDLFSFSLTNDLFKYSIRYKSITGEKDPKIYIYTKDDNVFVEHDDKTQRLIDSLGICVSDIYTGELRNPICININNNYSKFNPLNAESISISLRALNDKPAFVRILSSVTTDKYTTGVELISKILEK